MAVLEVVGCTSAETSAPPDVDNRTGVVQIAGAGFFSCARKADGSVWCWGQNDYGWLGDGTQTARESPTKVVGLTDVVDIVATAFQACALRKDATVWCWGGWGGSDRWSVAGDGTTDIKLVPTRVPGMSDIAKVMVGDTHSCARKVDDTVWCWGNNGSLGVVGNGGTGPLLTPTLVPALTGVQDISSSSYRTCGVLPTGRALCWGDGFGPSPSVVPELVDLVEMKLGYEYQCARRANGSVLCWGFNGFAALGDGTYEDRHEPTSVAGLTDVLELAASLGHTCARKRDGQVWCWGDEVGSVSPARVAGIAGAVGITSRFILSRDGSIAHLSGLPIVW